MTTLTMPIHIVGLGTGGSRVAREISEKGPTFTRELHGWDDDVVKPHNVRAQTYLPDHVGFKKVDALQLQVQGWGDIELIPHAERVGGAAPLSGVVFLCVDLMSNRQLVWESCIRNNPHVALMIEMRLETTGSLVHVVDPNNPVHVKKWERYWYPDGDSTTAGLSCGAATSFGPIASQTASLCVWQLVRAKAIQEGAKDRLDNQIRVSMVPLEIQTFQW